jgi:dihydroorotase
MSELITIKLPNDMHVHFREGNLLDFAVNATAEHFHHAVAMPNLIDPVTTYKKALKYYEQIQTVSNHSHFKPLVTMYLTGDIKEIDISEGASDSRVIGVKLYPAGVTTNSSNGVSNIQDCYKIFEWMEKYDLPLLVHGEVNNPETDIFDREKLFIDELMLITQNFPELRVIFEHISTKDAVDFVKDSADLVAATITPQHMVLNRNDLLSGGLKPHHYCLPVVKREIHRKAIAEAAFSGNRKFFLGTDSAPHYKNQKQSSCGCAGIFSASTALVIYLDAFDKAGALEKFEDFCVNNSSHFYRLAKTDKQITFKKEIFEVQSSYAVGDQEIIPFMANQKISWSIAKEL